MSPTNDEDSASLPATAADQAAIDVAEGAAGGQGVPLAPGSGRDAAGGTSERLQRLEGLLEDLASDLAVRNPSKRAQERHQVSILSSVEEGSSAFRQFLAAQSPRGRVDSLSEAMGIDRPAEVESPAMEQQRPVQFQQANMHEQRNEPFALPQNFGLKIPTLKGMKLPIERFSDKELYKGFGAGFKGWGLRFLDELIAAQVVSGGDWPEDFKARVLNRYLDGPAQKYFDRMKTMWPMESPTLEHLMNRMLEVYEKEITLEQATRMMKTRRPNVDGTVPVSASNCQRSGLFRQIRVAVYLRRNDYLRQAWEFADFASMFEADLSGVAKPQSGNSENTGNFGRGSGNTGNSNGNLVANAVNSNARSMGERRCWVCDQTDHIKQNCPNKKKPNEKATFVFTTGFGCGDSWVLDSGASRHYVRDKSLLVDAVDCHEDCKIADGKHLSVTMKGSVVLHAVVNGNEHTVVINDVYYAEQLTQNLLSYGKLEEKGLVLHYDKSGRYLMRSTDNARVFAVDKVNGVLGVRTTNVLNPVNMTNVTCSSDSDRRSRAVYVALAEAHNTNAERDVVEYTLMQLHKRLGHIMLDTVEKVADAPGSGIQLTDRVRINCLTCAKGKQSRNVQSKKDTDKHSPIDRIGGVVCSDLKGPMTLKNRCGNRYMVNFVDHYSNYCRVFVAKKKDQAAKKFEAF
ncbi:hypothetical protein PHMEG_00018746 [Phytophthora megakarya]|uniref:Retrovirus-related Pol polyprotein from transposon TNT 1-94-like beta-barrel domain-containing protein n=1 Tax=Phytophthora megakarya TaxID=4795 RepID=A0A225VVW1_9STRA|nr:hypothetical protein PHMEG_00018746 [Phytophthora megakarya]